VPEGKGEGVQQKEILNREERLDNVGMQKVSKNRQAVLGLRVRVSEKRPKWGGLRVASQSRGYLLARKILHKAAGTITVG